MRPELENVDALIDAAKAQKGLKSDNQLATHLKTNRANVSTWRRRGLPTEEYCMKLAKTAGLPEEEALLALNVWRAPDPVSKAIYAKLADRFTGAIFALIFAIGISTFSGMSAPAEARTFENKQEFFQSDFYIMRHYSASPISSFTASMYGFWNS